MEQGAPLHTAGLYFCSISTVAAAFLQEAPRVKHSLGVMARESTIAPERILQILRSFPKARSYCRDGIGRRGRRGRRGGRGRISRGHSFLQSLGVVPMAEREL